MSPTSPASLPPRSEIPEEETWDLASVFPDAAAWDRAAAALEARLPELGAFRGRLARSAEELLAGQRLLEAIDVALGKLFTYAAMCFDTDTADAAHAERWQRAQGLYAKVLAARAFEVPELLAAGAERIADLLAGSPELQAYRHRFDSLFRRAEHWRSREVEETLALASDIVGAFYTARSALVDADLRHAPVVLPDGARREVAEGSIAGLLLQPERSLRRAAWEHYADGFLGMRHVLAAQLAGHVKGALFQASTRGYPSVRAWALDADPVPEEAFEAVLAAFQDHLPVWHRYWALRRRALGLESLGPYDLLLPLTDAAPAVSFDQARDWILAGLAPLGDTYLAPLARGLGPERWVDARPSQGKRGGAYSGGAYGTHPFILMSWNGGLGDMSILAHELGHSMHSYFSRASQPPIYSEYSIFAAEVASNFNQALVRAHLLASQPDPRFQIALLGEALANFHRYFFVMPILARFEDAIYRQAEAGQGLTAEGMGALLAGLFREGYGEAVAVDEARVGIGWAQFPHLYMNYYVFQYATGIAAAHALAEGVLAGEPGAAERYLDFLKAGGSRYPVDALRLAGVDMTRREPIDRAFAVLAGYIDRLDALLGTS